MAKAGHCSECGENVWLNPDGSCENGHAASAVSGVYDAPRQPPSGVQHATTAAGSGWSRVPLLLRVILGVLLLPLTILYGIYVMWRDARFSTAMRVALTAAGAMLAFVMFASANTPASPAPVAVPALTAPTVTAPSVSPEPAKPAVVTTEVTTQDTTADATAVQPEPVAPPPPVAKPAPKAPAKVTVTVYMTRTGSKYHMNGCRYLKKSRIPVSLSEAKSMGLGP
jgi:hypothetical protein